MNIVVLGGGAWGTSLAIHLSKQYDVKVWEFLKDRVDFVNSNKKHDLFEAVIPNNVVFYNEIDIVKDADIVVVVVPSHVYRRTIEGIKDKLKSDAIIVSASKGLDPETLKPLTQVASELLPNKVVALSGPTFADEVSKGLLSSAVIACVDKDVGHEVQKIFSDSDFRFYYNDDPIGTQLCASLKNVFAIFTGILDGLKLGSNARAMIMTLGLRELKDLALKLGAQEKTFLGLAGVGDLILTCTSEQSRNFTFGKKLGEGKTFDEAKSEMTMIVEGIPTIESIMKLAEKTQTEMPLCKLLNDILFNSKDPKEGLSEFMVRELEDE